MLNNDTILTVNNLQTFFHTDDGIAKAVDDVSFSVSKGETLGIVGESGCGKSVTSLSIMRLISKPPGFFNGGSIIYDNQDILSLPEADLQHIRGNKISMIFQEPMTSLNPVFTVGNQIIEAIQLHQGLDIQEAENKAIEMLQLVGIPSPEQRIHEYPHQLSGGMRQRVMIAMSLSCNPEILIADEPTTALDVTIQAQILELIKKLQKELGLSVIMITHDLGVIAEICDRVIVMYAGQIVEEGAVKEIFHSPQHPYTQGLLKSIPKIGEHIEDDSLFNIKGVVPPATNYPVGCHFEPRCDRTIEKCKTNKPSLENIYDTHQVRCFECMK